MNIFLFDPTCLGYRIHVYDYFIQEFQKKGYRLNIFYDENRNKIEKAGFHAIRYDFLSFKKIHDRYKPDVSIFFIWLKYKFSLPFLLYCRFVLPVKTIVWSKGINISKINQPVMNLFYYARQCAAHALILYSNFEKQFIRTKTEKVFVANNTINQYAYPVKRGGYAELREKYCIKEKKAVLFVGRVQPRKRIDLLFDIFSKSVKQHALIIVGPGLPQELKDKADRYGNIYAFGPIYDMNTLSDLYSLSTVFCIPGEIGLGINEAFLFGLPVVTTFIRPTSEMKLLFRENVNGLLFQNGNAADLFEKLTLLLEDDDVYAAMSKKAREAFGDRGKIEYMFEGFLRAVEYVQRIEHEKRIV